MVVGDQTGVSSLEGGGALMNSWISLLSLQGCAANLRLNKTLIWFEMGHLFRRTQCLNPPTVLHNSEASIRWGGESHLLRLTKRSYLGGKG